MLTSWNQCTAFAAMAQAFLARNKDKETKLSYAINRVIARIQKQQTTVTEALSDIEIDHCVTEKHGEDDVIVRDGQGNLQFTREGIKKRNAETKKYLNEANIEIEPYFATKLPDGLSVFEIEAFAGFVISTEEAERLLVATEIGNEGVPSTTDSLHAVA